MMSPVRDESPPHAPHEPLDKVLLRDGMDIRRLEVQLFTRWQLPRIEITGDRFPQSATQRAQHRFTHLSKACNCVLGEVLGGITLLGGAFLVWLSSRSRSQLFWVEVSWTDVAWVLVVAANVFLIGKAFELAWTRLRLLQVLRALRRALDAPEEPTQPAPVIHAATVLPAATDVAADVPAPLPARPRAPRRRFQLRNAADINRVCLHLLTHRRLPRVQVCMEGLTAHDRQYAEHRYTHLMDGASQGLAAVLGTFTLVGGFLYDLWAQFPEWATTTRPDYWLLGLDWNDVQPVLIGAVGAALLGWMLDLTIIRVRLIRLLRSLRHQP